MVAPQVCSILGGKRDFFRQDFLFWSQLAKGLTSRQAEEERKEKVFFRYQVGTIFYTTLAASSFLPLFLCGYVSQKGPFLARCNWKIH